jgi:hypothetical protein
MKRFDAARGKPVAKPTVIEQRPLGHEDTKETTKDQLHYHLQRHAPVAQLDRARAF